MGARAWSVTVCAGALIAAVAHGCVDDGVSAHVICVIPPTLGEDTCSWEPDADTCQLDGSLNLLASSFYSMVLRVESGLKARVREVPPQGETSRIMFDRAEVELRSASGARFRFEDEEVNGQMVPVPNPYTVTATGYLPPGEVGMASSTVITPSYAKQLTKLFAANPAPSSAQIVIAIRLKGKTDGNTAISSGEFQWPVLLIRASANGADPDSSCYVPEPGKACGNMLGQDQFLNACTK